MTKLNGVGRARLVSDETRIALLDVGHSLCVAVTSGQEATLVDCPPSPVVETWLRRQGVSVIRHLIISCFDKNHHGGLDSLIGSGFRLERIWYIEDRANATGPYLDLQALLSDTAVRRGKPIEHSSPHYTAAPIEWAGIKFEWLLPRRNAHAPSRQGNAAPVVLRVLAEGCSVLCLGQIDAGSWADFDPAFDLTSDWVVATHKGGGHRRPWDEPASLMTDILARSGARFVYFSLSRQKFRLPLPEVARAAAGHARVVCSQISLRCSNNVPRLVCNHVASQGCSGAVCESCGGTVVLSSKDGFQWTDSQRHSELIERLDDPLCLIRDRYAAMPHPLPSPGPEKDSKTSWGQ